MTLKNLQEFHEKGQTKLVNQVERKAELLILPLLNKLQAKLKDPVKINYCNGDTWLGSDSDHGRYTNLTSWASSYGFEYFNAKPNKQELHYEQRFPELGAIFRIVAFLDQTRSCGVPNVKPTVKPYKFSKIRKRK